MAPDTQTHVPMMVWMPPAFDDRFGIDRGCVAAKADDPLSHDNLFHSVLGLLDVETDVRDPALDIFAGCGTRLEISSG